MIHVPPPPLPASLPSSSLDAPAKTPRSDGAEARNRLLDAALTLFAEQGFAKTSTREIALAAQVNISAIRYYFGDKAGLYRAVFMDPRGNPHSQTAQMDPSKVDLDTSLRALLVGFTAPLKQGHLVRSCMKLHFREILEPTGVWQAEIDSHIKPTHTLMAQVLCHYLGLKQTDDAVHRLVFSLCGLGLMVQVCSDVINAIRPDLIATPQSIDAYTEQLLGFAHAMVQSEVQRRALAPSLPDFSSP
jgi:TetR/AcrR family transcriptional regulator, regulator of cefoperazone and chloramphenicol sensitivity